jgi:hypothetical protein
MLLMSGWANCLLWANREPGWIPGLPRSGNWERRSPSSTGLKIEQSGKRRLVGNRPETAELAHKSENLSVVRARAIRCAPT